VGVACLGADLRGGKVSDLSTGRLVWPGLDHTGVDRVPGGPADLERGWWLLASFLGARPAFFVAWRSVVLLVVARLAAACDPAGLPSFGPLYRTVPDGVLRGGPGSRRPFSARGIGGRTPASGGVWRVGLGRYGVGTGAFFDGAALEPACCIAGRFHRPDSDLRVDGRLWRLLDCQCGLAPLVLQYLADDQGAAHARPATAV